MTHEPGGRSPRPQSTVHPSTPALPVSARGIEQIAAIVPYLFGYQPDHSLVLLTTRVDPSSGGGVLRGEIGFSARVDLPAREHLSKVPRALAASLRGGLREEDHLVLHVFCYDLPEDDAGEPDAGYAEELEVALAALADRLGLQLHDILQIRSRRHRPVLVAGTAVDRPWSALPDPGDVPATADLVLRGRSPLGSRDEVAAAVRRRDEAASAATDLALGILDLAPERLDEATTLSRLGSFVVEGAEAPSARERARIAVLLHDVQVRDAVLARWAPAMFALEDVVEPAHLDAFCAQVPPWPTAESPAALDRLLALAGCVPLHLTAPFYTLAAVAAWCHGEGTVAGVACDAALEADPGYRMAQLLDRALEGGLRPPGLPRAGGGRPAA